MPDDEEPYSPRQSPTPALKSGPVAWLKDFLKKRVSNSNDHLQEALDDFIEELKETEQDEAAAESQKIFITNVIRTHDLRVSDIMIPRADISAVDEDITAAEFAEFYKDAQFSRIPVYRESLDKIMGVLHIKDLLAEFLAGKTFDIKPLVREPVIVTPGMPIMDLFLMMREEKRHMAFVVDEHGGIDGLVTMNDIIEAIVGDIEDEFDQDDEPEIVEKPDGSLLIDARLEVEELEDRYGRFLNAEEREDVETLGGLAVHMAGRVPRRGESLKHVSGVVLDIIEADKRRVSRIRLRNVPRVAANDEV